MRNGLDDLILPPALPETNIGRDTDTMLAAVSPVHHHDLALSSSYRSHSPSTSSSSTFSLSQDLDFDRDMAFSGDSEAARRLLIPSSDQFCYPQPPATLSQQMLYTSQPTSLPTNQSWMSLPLFAQQNDSHANTLPPNNIYSPCHPGFFSSGGGVIPPTPQAIETPSFFSNLPSQPQQGFLAATTPSHATSYSSHESNATSLSRSCSPAPLTKTASAAPFPSSTLTEVKNSSPTPQPCQPTISSQPLSQSPISLHSYGIPVPRTSPEAPPTWRCAYPNCSSRALFTRGCDLRKHFNRHSKHLFCRVQGCPQSGPRILEGVTGGNANGFRGRLGGLAFGGGGGGFSSKKDRARHEAKHNPRILCEWVGAGGERCARKFSRVDNMKDHVRRIHRKGQIGEASANANSSERSDRDVAAQGLRDVSAISMAS